MSAPAIHIVGTGAVSPAGWGGAALGQAVRANTVIPSQQGSRDGSRLRPATRSVPKPESPLPFLRNPRLRRCSPITRYSVAAALEALGDERRSRIEKGDYRLGIVFVFMNGCVNYSNRFFGEVLENPELASPILFPETVFNAPASHLAAMIASTGPATTRIGDSAHFLTGLEEGISWLLDNQVDGSLVVGAEELDWLSSEAAMLFSREAVASEGAGALLLERASEKEDSPQVACITPAFTYASGQSRSAARQLAQDALDAYRSREQADRTDPLPLAHIEDRDAKSAVPMHHFAMNQILGDAMGAALALQCVFACQLLGSNDAYHAVDILHAGSNQQALGARFTRS